MVSATPWAITIAIAVLMLMPASAQTTAPLQPPAGAGTIQAEIQIGLCAPADRIVQALDLHPRGTPLEVWHFDDGALSLLERGLRLRLRVAADGRSEFTLKVADQDCARLDPGLVPPGAGKCEYDAYGTRMAGAVSLTRKLGAKSTQDLVAGNLAPADVLGPSQIRYLREVVGLWPLPPGTRALGPMQLRTYRSKGNRYDVDISQLPNGEQYAEIARKVPAADAARAKSIMEADVARRGLEACADQSSQAATKLRALLR